MKKVALGMIVSGIALAAVSWAAKPVSGAADIVDTAVSSKKFPTLVKALQAAGLVDTLKGDGPFTVFAPTEEAFKKVPKRTLESLLKPENKETLAAVLKYHVVPGKVVAADVLKLKDGTKVKTVQGEKVTISNTHGVKINNATVVKTDIECSNGVIHVIDTVILPPKRHHGKEKTTQVHTAVNSKTSACSAQCNEAD